MYIKQEKITAICPICKCSFILYPCNKSVTCRDVTCKYKYSKLIAQDPTQTYKPIRLSEVRDLNTSIIDSLNTFITGRKCDG